MFGLISVIVFILAIMLSSDVMFLYIYGLVFGWANCAR
jgi:hypothetical protein